MYICMYVSVTHNSPTDSPIVRAPGGGVACPNTPFGAVSTQLAMAVIFNNFFMLYNIIVLINCAKVNKIRSVGSVVFF